MARCPGVRCGARHREAVNPDGLSDGSEQKLSRWGQLSTLTQSSSGAGDAHRIGHHVEPAGRADFAPVSAARE
jgi:hypothetical protein